MILDDIVNKIDNLLKDPESEGEKIGYVQAAQKYEPIFEKIEREYDSIISLFSSNVDEYNDKLDELTDKIRELEEKRNKLRLKFFAKYCEGQNGYYLSSTGDFERNNDRINYFDLILNSNSGLMRQELNFQPIILYGGYRKKRAIIRGYREAEITYVEKIKKMIDKYIKIRIQLKEDDNECLELIDACLTQITNLTFEISQLELLQ